MTARYRHTARAGNVSGVPMPARKLRVLVACEYSGTVRRAFAAMGHDVWSCDLLPAEDDSARHIVGDARALLGDGWDLLIAHPPCTRLCNSGVRWLSSPPAGKTLADMWRDLGEGAALFSAFWNAPIPRICIENPVMHRHAKERIEGYQEFTQSVQPWQFGHPETKRTCFWLRGLPALTPTDIVAGREARVHLASPGPDRWKERSRFFSGIADAMASQWSTSPTRAASVSAPGNLAGASVPVPLFADDGFGPPARTPNRGGASANPGTHQQG